MMAAELEVDQHRLHTVSIGIELGPQIGVTPLGWTRTRLIIDQAARRRLVFSNCTGLR